jgi:hypothetical protein
MVTQISCVEKQRRSDAEPRLAHARETSPRAMRDEASRRGQSVRLAYEWRPVERDGGAIPPAPLRHVVTPSLRTLRRW